MASKVKCTCGWSWDKSNSSKKDMYICHECGRDNSNNMKNGGDILQAQVGKVVPPKTETEIDRAKKVAKKVAGTTGIGMVLDQFPGVETAYDAYNVIDAFGEGDPMKILPNMLGALIPGTAGKSFEAVTDEYLPKTPKKEKEKMKAVLKGKRATPEQMKKIQESVDWSGGFKKLYDDVGSLFEKPSLIDKEKVIKYFNTNRKDQLENGGWLDNYNDSQASAPEGMEGDGFSNVGRNYSPAWGGSFQMGGSVYPVNYVPQAQGGMSMPGSVGFTYARTQSPAPSNGKYAKKTMASAQNGKEMQYYQNGLDWQPKSISRNGSVIKDDRGQWDHPGEITEIGSNDITMEGVPYDVLGVSDTGDVKMMKPGKNYKFKGKKVTEYPMAKNGLRQEQKGLQNLDNLTNFTNYNKPTVGGWLNKYN